MVLEPLLEPMFHPDSYGYRRKTKAHSTKLAYDLASTLAVFAGASAYQEEDRIAKTHRDIQGPLFAHGIVDAPMRSSGRLLQQRGWLGVSGRVAPLDLLSERAL